MAAPIAFLKASPDGQPEHYGAAMERTRLTIVDVANVVGSRPDGWWRDPVAGTRRLIELADRLPRQEESLVLVLEGEARRAAAEVDCSCGVRVLHAPGSGDDRIVTLISETVCAGDARQITVVTADRLLRLRAEGLGAGAESARAFRERLEASAQPQAGD